MVINIAGPGRLRVDWGIMLRVWVCHGQKKIFFEFIVGLDRVAQDKLFGVGMTLLRPRVCPLETV